MRTLLVCALVMATTAIADAKHHKYIGIHPVAKSHGDGMCLIEGPHVHIFEADKLQYRDHHGAAYFVGDPVAYGYEGPKHAYKGHHPIHVHAVVGTPEPDIEFCYLDGPHYHYFVPPDGPEFKLVGDAYFYVAEPPKVYAEARPVYVGINAIYTPIAYARPAIIVAAPVGWIGARVHVGGPAVIVRTPPPPRVRVDVRIPTPSLRVDVGVGIGVRGKVKIKGGKRGRR